MPQRKPFPPEPETRPHAKDAKTLGARQSSPTLKGSRQRAEAPTVPPPRPAAKQLAEKETPRPPRGKSVSSVRAARSAVNAATIDEVTADMSRDPRREHDRD